MPDAGSLSEECENQESLRIAVIDDEVEIRRAIRRTLGSTHTYEEAATVEEAVEILRRGVDLVFLDFHLQDKTAVMLLRKLREEGVPLTAELVIISGSGGVTMEAADTAVLEANNATIMGKPFDREKLMSIVKKVVEQKGSM